MHILRKLKCFLTLHACKPIVGDSQNNIRNLKGHFNAMKTNNGFTSYHRHLGQKILLEHTPANQHILFLHLPEKK